MGDVIEWVPVAILILIIGLAIGRLTHPSRSDVEKYADDIARKGFERGYKEGWQDSKVEGMPRYWPDGGEHG